MTLVAGLQAFTAKVVTRLDDGTRLTVTDVAGRVINELSPVGDPTLWMRAPPASYRPGTFRSNWNYGLGAPDKTATLATDITSLNGIENMPAKAAGLKHYISNSVEYAQALEYGHSSQAPVGILGVIAFEMVDIAHTDFAKVAA
jgi:hypothetical protein